MSKQKLVIAVIGGGRNVTPDLLQTAETVGRCIAQSGAALICGGLGGIMEAACRGACEAGGETIGVLPSNDKESANPWVTLPIATNMGSARNLIIVQSASAVIAVGGAYGTLSEIAFSLDFGKPIIGMQSWDIDPAMQIVKSPEEAVRRAVELAGKNT
jgi:uncharacterized protein (TIGR00725 family)